MMLQRWLKKSTHPAPPPGLPDPNTIKNPEIAEEQAAINREVVATTPTRKRKRGDYNAYDDETRAKIAKYAQEHGNTKAARHFSTKLGRKIAKSTVPSMKLKFLRERPLMLGELDKRVQTAIRRIREDGEEPLTDTSHKPQLLPSSDSTRLLCWKNTEVHWN